MGGSKKMNEEELKKDIEELEDNLIKRTGEENINEIIKYLYGEMGETNVIFYLLGQAKSRLEGFQKGKLEQKKEELKFLLEIKGELSSLVATKQLFLSGYNKLIFIQARIKQLQKEIGR